MITVLFATTDPAECDLFRRVVRDRALDIQTIVPGDLHRAHEVVAEGVIDVIVTDLHFQDGDFAEWLFLWQHPFMLLVDWNECDQAGEIVKDQTSDFTVRDPQLRHIHYLPMALRKLLNNKEAMERQNLDLRATEQRYSELVQALPDIIYSLDGEGRFVFVNDSIRRLGWNPVELIGKHFDVIIDPEDMEKVSRRHVAGEHQRRYPGQLALFDERKSDDHMVKLKRKTNLIGSEDLFGSIITYGEVNAVGFVTPGQPVDESGSIGIIRDITQRKEAEEIVRRSLREKELLLSEIHHRVKNNLQVISSLLNLQSGGIRDEEAQGRFADAQMQIQSMALVHEHLYQSGIFGTLNMSHYVESLCGHLFDIYGAPHEHVALDICVEAIPISIRQAMPIALILNELVSNSLKYAFPGDRSGTIRIAMSLTDEDYVELVVDDDGVGFPDNFEVADGATLGHTLIHSLVHQLDGTLDIAGKDGVRCVIRFAFDHNMTT